MAKISTTRERFITHWGEMGAKWGINRTVAQIHALLHTAERPLHAEEICDTLAIARSNASNSLKELQGWGIVRIVHLKGDRREHFESVKEVWELFRIIINERRKREIDPTLALVRECLDQPADDAESPVFRERLAQLQGFMESVCAMHDAVNRIPTSALARFTGSVETLVNLTGLSKGK